MITPHPCMQIIISGKGRLQLTGVRRRACSDETEPPLPASCPRLSRASTSFLRAFSQEDMDGRDKPGHDAKQMVQHDQRSEEHTSELQSHLNLVCRLLLEKKKKYTTSYKKPALITA